MFVGLTVAVALIAGSPAAPATTAAAATPAPAAPNSVPLQPGRTASVVVSADVGAPVERAVPGRAYGAAPSRRRRAALVRRGRAVPQAAIEWSAAAAAPVARARTRDRQGRARAPALAAAGATRPRHDRRPLRVDRPRVAPTPLEEGAPAARQADGDARRARPGAARRSTPRRAPACEEALRAGRPRPDAGAPKPTVTPRSACCCAPPTPRAATPRPRGWRARTYSGRAPRPRQRRWRWPPAPRRWARATPRSPTLEMLVLRPAPRRSDPTRCATSTWRTTGTACAATPASRACSALNCAPALVRRVDLGARDC